MAKECVVCFSLALTFDASESTLAYCPVFTDTNGRLHLHDVNKVLTKARCVNGHHMTFVDGPLPCPTCGEDWMATSG